MKFTANLRLVALLAPSLAVSGVVGLGCAASGEDDNVVRLNPGDGSGASGNGSGDLNPSEGGAGDGGLTPDSACAFKTVSAEPVPLDLYFMLDRSGSMARGVGGSSRTIWDAVRDAFKLFIADSATDGMSVSLGFFPNRISETPPIECGGLCPRDDLGNPLESSSCPCGNGGQCSTGVEKFCYADSCLPSDYKTPAVDFDLLPGARTMLDMVLDSTIADGGGTPTVAALQGSLHTAMQRALAMPDHEVIVVLATDGRPNLCFPQDPAGINQIVGNFYNNTPSISTYAIGAGYTDDVDDLHALAQAGGTNEAFVVEMDLPPVEMTQDFIEVMNTIRNAAAGCDYLLPEPDEGELDPQLVNVNYTDASGTTTIPMVNGEADCGGEVGWYYDNPDDPARIAICPALCETLNDESGSKLDILLGCATILR